MYELYDSYHYPTEKEDLMTKWVEGIIKFVSF